MIKKEDIVNIGRFAKPHGIKGEINLMLSKEVSFDEWDEPYIICEIDGMFIPFYLEEYRYKSDTALLVKMENINSDGAAREFSNREAYCPPDVILENNDDDLTWNHFIGYKVLDDVHGLLGEITDIDESTINILLVINHKDTELLIPAVEELILTVDHDNKQLIVELPDGLLDL